MKTLKNRAKNRFYALCATIALWCTVLFTPLAPAYSAQNDLSIIRDTEIEAILKSWTNPVFKAAGLDPEAVHIILVRNDATNAFVAGGANIFIYTGLINKTENPGELIGVIAHETGHIVGGHLIRSREAMEKSSYEAMIGTILGVGAAIASGDGSAAPAVMMGGSSIAQSSYLAHSRVQESSADQAALTFLDKAQINPSGLESFMEKMKADIYVPQSQQSEYIQTHPLMENRMDALKLRVSQSPYKNKDYPALWKEQHARMKAKLIGFIHPGQVPWIYDDRDQSISAQYARAIAAYQQNNLQEALSKTDKLIEQEPQNPYFFELKAQMLMEFGQVEQAALIYRKACDLLPQDPLLRIALAHALIESPSDDPQKNLGEAIKDLEYALPKEPRSTRIHRLLATAYGRLGQENQAKLHLAEEAVLQKNFGYAKKHIEAVLATEKEGSPTWVKAKDLLVYIEGEKEEQPKPEKKRG